MDKDSNEDSNGSDDNSMLALTHDVASHTMSLVDLALPMPRGPDEHLVQVRAVALTNNELTWLEPAALQPSIPGYEFAGTVVQAPPPSPFVPGTDVYAFTALTRQGNAREFTIAHTSELRQKPETVSWEEAATVPMSALTAWQALFVHGGLSVPMPPFLPFSGLASAPASASASNTTSFVPTRPLLQHPYQRSSSPIPRPLSRHSSRPTSRASSRPPSRTSSRPSSSSHHRSRSRAADDTNATKRILITDAAGGVGLWAIQLARLAGVSHITASCSLSESEFVRGLGAHRVVDVSSSTERSQESSYPGRARSSSIHSDKYDLILDCVGGDTLRHAWTSARHGGIVISTAVPSPERYKPETGVGMDLRGVYFQARPDSEQLQAVSDLIEMRAVKAVFDSAYTLEQYEAAMARARAGADTGASSGHVRGKVVLTLM